MTTNTMPVLCAVLASLFVACAPVTTGKAEDTHRRKKLIATGWDHPDSTRLLANLAEMERRPFDGVVVELTGRTDAGKPCLLRAAFCADKWRAEWFKKCADELKACRFKRFTDNFVLLGANPGNVDWFDDDGWASVVEHWRIAAAVVKQSGFKGIQFDPEPYTPPHSAFSYPAQAQEGKRTFREYCAKVRQRGKEAMQAVAGECPDIVLFCYFMNSVVGHAAAQDDPQAALESDGYGLLPAFIDGLLDAAPPTVTMVDGCENAYLYNSVTQYLEAGTLIKGDCQKLVSPANRAKYRAQVQSGFGIYLDAYWNPKGSPWYIDAPSGTRVDVLRRNVQTSLRVADEYVWVYGEKFRWWPTPNQGVKKESWEEALPGCERVLGLSRDRIQHAHERIDAMRKAGKLENLVRNGDFASDKATAFDGSQVKWKDGAPPAGWSAWQDEKSKGQFGWDRRDGASGPGAAGAVGVASGCFLQSIPAKPGETYAVQVACRTRGNGKIWVRVRWQTADGQWAAEIMDKTFVPREADPASTQAAKGTSGTPDERGWRGLFGVVEVPQGAGRLVVLLSVAGQAGPDDVAWFDDVGVFRIE